MYERPAICNLNIMIFKVKVEKNKETSCHTVRASDGWSIYNICTSCIYIISTLIEVQIIMWSF